MVAEAWKKEIAWIYLPLIGEDRCIVPSGVKMPAVCQLMGTRLKRCQVVEDMEAEGELRKGGGGGEETGRGGKGTQYERQALGRAVSSAALSCIFPDRGEARSAEETSERAKSPERLTQTTAPF